MASIFSRRVAINLNSDSLGSSRCHSVRFLVGRNLLLVRERQADVVQTIEQAVPAKRLDLKRYRQARLVRDPTGLQVDLEFVTRLRRAAEQIVDRRIGEPYRKHPVFE